MQQPLAIAILGGVSLSMLFSLIGVPLLYCCSRRARRPRSGAGCACWWLRTSDAGALSAARACEEAAWTVDVVRPVDEAWRLLLLNPYDLIVLDLGLPDADGGELLRRLREAAAITPVLILTARGAVEDRVAGLNAGADDYLSKPFAFAELLARINALRRRGRQADVRGRCGSATCSSTCCAGRRSAARGASS